MNIIWTLLSEGQQQQRVLSELSKDSFFVKMVKIISGRMTKIAPGKDIASLAAIIEKNIINPKDPKLHWRTKQLVDGNSPHPLRKTAMVAGTRKDPRLEFYHHQRGNGCRTGKS
jgi:hypothetical protein